MTPPLPFAPGGKTVIFHIGDHRTGMETIQSAFASGHVQPDGASVLWPGQLPDHNHLPDLFTRACTTGADTTGASSAKASTDNLPSSGKTGQTGKTEKTGKIARFDLADLQDMIANAKEDFILISSEGFEDIDPACFHQIITSHIAPVAGDIRVIAYVRPHHARLTADYAEMVKNGAATSGDAGPAFRQALKSGRLAFAPRFHALRAAFGDRFILRPMIEDELHKGTLLDDFIRTAFAAPGHTVSPGYEPYHTRPAKIGDLVLMRFLQAHLDDAGKMVRRGIGSEIARHIARITTGQGVPFHLHRPLTRKLAQACAEDATAIDAEFFDGRPVLQTQLDQAPRNAPKEPVSLDPADHFSPDELRNITALARTLSVMLSNGSVDWAQAFRKRRARALKSS